MSKRIFFPLILFGTASAVFAVLVAYPIFRGITRDYNAAVIQKQELAQLQEDRKRLQELDSVLTQYQQEFAELKSLFLDIETPIEFFRFLDISAEEFRVELKKTPGVPQKLDEDLWGSMTVNLTGSGAYTDVEAFLQKVEYAPYVLELQKLSIAEGIKNQVRFSALLKVYTKQ